MTALYLIGIVGGVLAFTVGIALLAVPFILLAIGAYARAYERDYHARSAH